MTEGENPETAGVQNFERTMRTKIKVKKEVEMLLQHFAQYPA